MSKIILPTSRRGFLTGLIVAPAIVASTNIMPVKAIEKFSYVDTYSDWVLARYRNSEDDAAAFWIKKSVFDTYSHNTMMDVVHTTKIPFANVISKNRMADETKTLRRVGNYNVVTFELPSCMTASSDIRRNWA